MRRCLPSCRETTFAVALVGAALIGLAGGCGGGGGGGGGKGTPPAGGGGTGTGSTTTPGGGSTTTPGGGSGSGSTTTPGGGSGSGSTTPGGGSGSGTTPPPAGPTHKVSAWLPDWGQEPYQSLDAHFASMDEVMPCWYQIKTDGTVLARSARTLAFVREQHARGVEVVPMIDDFITGGAGPIIRDAAKAQRLMQAILAEVDTYELDGIDIDFEGMGEVSRDPFSRWMADLGRELRARGKILSAAIYGKTSEPGGWSGPKSHDYAALGQSVDRFKIMTYGYTGPIAPVPYIERVITFAKTLVPAQKIYIGIPFYGYDKDPSGNKRALTETTAEALRRRVGATATQDATSGEVTFTYTEAGVQRTVWYQNGASIAAKCEVAKRLGVAGVAIWRLGGETNGIWDAIDRTYAPAASSTP